MIQNVGAFGGGCVHIAPADGNAAIIPDAGHHFISAGVIALRGGGFIVGGCSDAFGTAFEVAILAGFYAGGAFFTVLQATSFVSSKFAVVAEVEVFPVGWL